MKNKTFFTGDTILFGLSLLATLFGLIFIFDAGYARSIQAGHGIIPREFKSQLIFSILSIVSYFCIAKIPFSFWKKSTFYIFIIGVISVLLVEIPGLGKEMNGARRWLGLGPFLIQPAEFMKVGIILFLSKVFSIQPSSTPRINKPKNWGERLDHIIIPQSKTLISFTIVLLVSYLIEREPDLGTAAVIIATSFSLLILSNISLKLLFKIILIGILGIGFLVSMEPYRIQRIMQHTNRWQPQVMDELGYQTVQSEAGMASGGLVGVGIGSGRAKHMLPAATTDFILATIAEETGLLGVTSMLGILSWISFCLIQIGRRMECNHARLTLFGTSIWIAIQTSVNVMMANGTLPAIGIPIPFVSSGGSSLLATWIGIGFCASAIRQHTIHKRKLKSKTGHL